MPKLNALDESWGRISPAAAKANNIQVVYGYLSHDPSKNLTSNNVKSYHKSGVGVWLGWESETGRPLLGAAAGKDDAQAAKSQIQAHIKNLGYKPGNILSIPFSCDRDINSSQLPTILKYYEAAQEELGSDYYVGAYGEFDLIKYLYQHGFKHGLFQTYAWSNGKQYAHADLYQYQNGQVLGGASVDYDTILNAANLGAWWPPGSKYDTGETTVTKDEIDAIVKAVWTAKLTEGKTSAQAATWVTHGYRYAQESASNTANLDTDALVAAISKQGVAITKAQIETALTEVLNNTSLKVD